MKNRKLHKIFICFMVVIMALSATSVTAMAAEIWSGEASNIIPSRSNDGFYLIQNGEDLAWFANQVNADAGNSTMKARLVNDIYLSDPETSGNAKNWMPIGNYGVDGRVFSGIFDGKGFTVYGLTISGTSDFQGLFGYLENAQVKNVNFANVNVSGGNNIGVVAGYSNNKTSITQIYIEKAEVTGADNVGGVTGYLANGGNISYCGFDGKIKATGHRVGGITGCVFSDSTISQSFNMGEVYSTGKYVGGIAGTNSGSVVISCYNRGKISGDLRVAGIVGNNVGDISSCFNASVVESISTPAGLTGAIAAFYYTAKITDCYYDATLFTGKEDNGIPMETEDMKRHAFVNMLNSAAGNYYYDYLIKNNGYPIMSWQADQNLWDGTVSEPKLSSDGKYYMITNARELAWFAGLVNGTLDDGRQNSSAGAMLMNSIVLNIGNLGEESNIWTPIGSVAGNEFDGEFSGNGFSIRGLYVPSGDCVGLFGTTGTAAIISDLTITESLVVGTNYVGSVVGNNSGKINGMKIIYSEVIGETNVGGIVGENDGQIIDSASIYSDVTGTKYVGGIAGITSGNSVVETCCAYNTVIGEELVGGIAGESFGSISRSFSSSEVTATKTYAGGIAGRISDGSLVSNCYNRGVVSAAMKAGGISGGLRTQGIISSTYSVGDVLGIGDEATYIYAIVGELVNGTVEYSYYDKDKITVTDRFAEGLKTTKMTGLSALDNLIGFSRQYWQTTADTEFFVNYPQLDTFVSSADYDLFDISAESVAYLKAGLICKVISSNETSYYKTLSEATKKIGTGTGVIEVMENLEKIQTEAVITGNVTIIPTNDSIKLTRVKHYYDKAFTVKDGGVLNFGADDAKYAVLNINGNNVVDITNTKFASSLITVEDGGVFNCYDVVTTNNTAGMGGFVYNEGTVNFYGGSISTGTGLQAGGVAYNKGEMNIFSAEMTNNNAKLAGGAIFNAGGTLNIYTGADIYSNTSGEGGAVYAGAGTVNLNGGAIYLNSASYGGAFSVAANGKLNIYDGAVYENTSTVSGGAIYTEGTLNFYSGAFIDSSNDVYLPYGEKIMMMAKSIYSSSVVTVTPEIYEEGVRILDGDYKAMNSNLCSVTPNEETVWHVNSGGRLTTDEIRYVLTASFFNSDEVPYTSIEEAMVDIGDKPAIITLIDDIVLKETVIIKSNITIESDGIEHSISVNEGFEGPMFRVVENADPEQTVSVLSFGNITDNYTADVLYINGTNVTADSMIEVTENGVLKIYSGTVIFGANRIDSAISSVGTVEMNGGKITENNTDKGALCILGGEMNFFGGTIFDNENVGIYSSGTLNIYDGAGVHKSNSIYLTDGNTINVQRPDPIYDDEGVEIEKEYIIPELIGKVEMENYIISSSIIETNDDLSKYSGKFSLADSTYSLDENNVICADDFSLRGNATIIIDKYGQRLVYGMTVNTYTAKGLCLQFENVNIALYDKKGNRKDDNDKVGTGDVLVLLDGSGKVYRSLSVVIYGDVDGDGDVNANDAFVTKMYIYGYFLRSQFVEAQIKAMDVNHDYIVTETDTSMMEDMGISQGEIIQSPYK